MLFFLLPFGAAVPWALAQEDALSAPTPPMGLHLAQPRPPSDHSNEKFEVVQPSGTPEAAGAPAGGRVGSGPSAETTAEPDETPAPTLAPKTATGRDRRVQKSKNEKGPTAAAGTPTPYLGPGLPWVTAIPNPARGDKVDFRIMTQDAASAQIVVYNRFLDRVAKLEAQGDRLFDALWSLKHVPEGLYYYQVRLTDDATGKVQVLPIKNFAVLKN